MQAWGPVEPRLLTDRELEEIRAGVAQGIHGPVLHKWMAQLLADHDERVRLEQERGKE